MSKTIDMNWHDQQQHILKKWGETSSSYRYLHDKSHLMYSRQHLWFALPVIIISTITGTANFAQSSFPESMRDSAPAIIGTFNLIAGLITTIAQFLKVSELLESHRVASIAFGKLARNISVELSLPISERSMNGSEFLSQCRNEIDKLIEQSPSIPLKILKSFDKRFKEHDFIKPDILDITSVDIYVNNEEEEAEKKQQIITRELELRKKIIEDEKQKELVAYENIRKLKKSTKKVVDANSVHKSLDKLMTSFRINSPINIGNNTESSSESDDEETAIKIVDEIVTQVDEDEDEEKKI